MSKNVSRTSRYYERGVRCGVTWLTAEAAEELEKHLGKPARHREKMKYLSQLIMKDLNDQRPICLECGQPCD